MSKSRRHLFFALGAAASLLAGCKSFFAPRGVPHDPLLLSRQPIESRGEVTRASGMVHHEPLPPENPTSEARRH